MKISQSTSWQLIRKRCVITNIFKWKLPAQLFGCLISTNTESSLWPDTPVFAIGKSSVRAASTQSFTPWQQATIEGDHKPQSFYYCLFAPHIHGCCSSHTSRSWWVAHSTQRQPNNIPSFLQRIAPIARFFLWRLHLTRPSHSSHSTILLRL